MRRSCSRLSQSAPGKASFLALARLDQRRFLSLIFFVTSFLSTDWNCLCSLSCCLGLGSISPFPPTCRARGRGHLRRALTNSTGGHAEEADRSAHPLGIFGPPPFRRRQFSLFLSEERNDRGHEWTSPTHYILFLFFFLEAPARMIKRSTE